MLVVFSGKTLNGMASSLSGKPVAEPNSPPIAVAQSNGRLAKRAVDKFIILDASPKVRDLAHTKRVVS